MAVVRALLITSMPFVVAGIATGVTSLLTSQLSMPPLFGVGTIIDVAILAAGIVVAINRPLKNV